jgi:hypothetical protein
VSPFTAATATPDTGPLVWAGVVVIGLLAAAVYAASCWWFPFAACPRCHGTGKRTRGDGKVHRLCKRCDGTGRRLRVGRRVYNAYTRRRDAITATNPHGGKG